MNLAEGIKQTGNPAEIPDCPRDSLPIFFKEMGFKVGAELGVYRGDFTKKFCQVNMKIFSKDRTRSSLYNIH